jgi:hypothetical protein
MVDVTVEVAHFFEWVPASQAQHIFPLSLDAEIIQYDYIKVKFS